MSKGVFTLPNHYPEHLPFRPWSLSSAQGKKIEDSEFVKTYHEQVTNLSKKVPKTILSTIQYPPLKRRCSG